MKVSLDLVHTSNGYTRAFILERGDNSIEIPLSQMDDSKELTSNEQLDLIEFLTKNIG